MASSSEWIAFLDSDDYWKPNRITSNLKLLGDSNLNLLCSNAELHFMNDSEINRLYHARRQAGKFKTSHLLYENIVVTSSAIVRKSALRKVGGFVSLPANPCEDFATWLRVSTQGGCYYNAVPEVVYSYSETSYSRTFVGELEKIAVDNFAKWVWKSRLKPIQVFRLRIQLSEYKSRRFAQELRAHYRKKPVD